MGAVATPPPFADRSSAEPSEIREARMAGSDAERPGGTRVGYRPDDGSGTEGLVRCVGPLTTMGGLVLVLVAVLALRETASFVVRQGSPVQ
jgi:hypothetical protein